MSEPICECYYDAALHKQSTNCPLHDPYVRCKDYEKQLATLEAKLTRRDAAFAALVKCVRATDQFSESLNSCLSCRANLAINQTLCNFHGGRQHWVTEQRRAALKLAEGVEG